jgi:sodium/hydrogen antiporter
LQQGSRSAVVVALKLEASRFFSPEARIAELFPLSVGAVIFALASLLHSNEFLAAFAAGVTVATASPYFKDTFQRFGQLIAELLKLAARFIFGALVQPSFFTDVAWGGYLFAFLVLFMARPLALAIAIGRSPLLSLREWVAAAWFGPKGFASMVYGLLIAGSGIPGAQEDFRLISVVVLASIVLHSSTDVVVARQFDHGEAESESAAARKGPA